MDYNKAIEKQKKQGGRLPTQNFGVMQGARGKDKNKQSTR